VDKLGSAASHEKMVGAVRGVAAAANKDRELSQALLQGDVSGGNTGNASAGAPAGTEATTDVEAAANRAVEQEFASLPLSSALLRLLVGTHVDWERARALGSEPATAASSSSPPSSSSTQPVFRGPGIGDSDGMSSVDGAVAVSSSSSSGSSGSSDNEEAAVSAVADLLKSPLDNTEIATSATSATAGASTASTAATTTATTSAATLTAMKAATAAARGALWNQLASAPPEGLPSSPAEVCRGLMQFA